MKSAHHIPSRIRAARIAKGFTQAQVGEAMGYSQADQAQRYVSGWETGVRKIPRKHLVALAELLDLEVSDLLE